jgi:hypothetical protein
MGSSSVRWKAAGGSGATGSVPERMAAMIIEEGIRD